MAKPTINLVVRRWSTQGGTEKYTFDLCNELLRRGWSVIVWCRGVDAPVPTGLEVRRMSWLQVAMSNCPTLSMVRWPIPGVHRAGGGSHRAWLEASGQDIGWKEHIELFKEFSAFQAARVIVANSNASARAISQHTQTPVCVVWNGVDLERFRPDLDQRRRIRKDTPATGRIALFLGNGFQRKGLETAICAFERVATVHDRLWVAGQDRHAELIRQSVIERLGERVYWWGAVREPERLLSGADALLLPTKYDSAANVTMEAMACGIPPVVSSADGNAERVSDSQLIVNSPVDVDGFAQALLYAWEQKNLRESMRATAENWPISRHVNEMEPWLTISIG